MPDFDRDRLLHYCRLLDDPDQGRRLAAARGIATFVKTQGLDWDDIIVKAEAVKVAGVTVAAPTDWPHVKFCGELLTSGAPLSKFEREFCESLSNWRRPPTEKQAAVLERLEARFGSRVNTQGVSAYNPFALPSAAADQLRALHAAAGNGPARP